jgi:branched-chain amino acid transport system substrate-binding protein
MSNLTHSLLGATVLSLATLFAGSALAEEPICIGVPASLSGPNAQAGESAKRGIDFAVKQKNAAGGVKGRQIEVRYLDTEGKPDLARLQAEKLALGGCKIITGIIASNEALAIIPNLARWKAISVSGVPKTNELTGSACSPYYFRTNPAVSSDISVVRQWLSDRKEKKWALLMPDFTWGHSAADQMKKMIGDISKEVAMVDFVPLGTSDYAPYIQKIRSSGAEGIWTLISGSDAINFTKQAAQFGLLKNHVVGGISFMTDHIAEQIGDPAVGIYGVVNYSPTIDTPRNKEFVSAWQAEYKTDTIDTWEGESYTAATVILQALEKAKSDSIDDLIAALEGGTFTTVKGEQTMRAEDHQMTSPNYFARVEKVDGTPRMVISESFAADKATPAPDGQCKF